MSKRSYRSLAVVAGAALAIGSMAPAMAARVETDNEVGVTTFDITDVSSSVLPIGLDDLDTTLVTGIASTLVGTAFYAPHVLLPHVRHLVGNALCIPGLAVGAALGVNAGAIAGVGVGLGGVRLGLAGVVNAPLAVVGGVAACALGAVGEVVHTAVAAAGLAAPVVSTAGLVVHGALATATGLPATVVGLPTHLLNGGLGTILNVRASSNSSFVLSNMLGTI